MIASDFAWYDALHCAAIAVSEASSGRDAMALDAWQATRDAATVTTAPAVRGRPCPLCDAPPGTPCQPKPAGDHLARYLDAYTAGKLTRAYMCRTLSELIVIDVRAVITGGAR